MAKSDIPEQPQITATSWLMIAVLGLTWGATFMLIELVLEDLGPFWLAFARLAIASLVMLIAWGWMRCPLVLDPLNRPRWYHYAWTGAVSAGIPFVLLSWGQTHVTSAFAGTSMAAVPLVVLPLAHFLVPAERLTPRSLIGVTLGFAGVFLLIGDGVLNQSGARLETWGQLACISVAVCYAVNSVSIRRLPPVDPIGLTTMMMIWATLIVLPVAIALEGWPALPTGRALAALFALGIVSTAAMNFLRVQVIRTAGPTFMTLVNYQVPVWSVVLGAWVLGEALPPELVPALGLILLGVAISQWQALRRLARRA